MHLQGLGLASEQLVCWKSNLFLCPYIAVPARCQEALFTVTADVISTELILNHTASR